MELIKQVLMSNLIRQGIFEACGKPVEKATINELRDEWSRFELKKTE